MTMPPSYTRALLAARMNASRNGRDTYIVEVAGRWTMAAGQPHRMPYVKVHADGRAVRHERAVGDPMNSRQRCPVTGCSTYARLTEAILEADRHRASHPKRLVAAMQAREAHLHFCETKRSRKDPSRKSTSKKVSPREAVFAALWNDKRYLRLHAYKDSVGKAWNRADAWKHTKSGDPKEAERLSRMHHRAMARLQRYEDAALRKAGLTP